MVRRAFIIASLLGAVSAAGALAFAPELTRGVRALTAHAGRLRGFTPVSVDRTGAIHPSTGRLEAPTTDSLEGKYCRFPTDDDEAGKNEPERPSLSAGSGSDSSGILTLSGQSGSPQSPGGDAVCAGTPPTVPQGADTP